MSLTKRQQRHTAIAVGILLVVAVIFLMMRGGTQQITDEPREWARVANLERIELIPPAESERSELIVLEKRGGDWWIRRPVEAPMDWSVAERFETRFGRKLVGEQTRADPERLDSYDLSDDRGVIVRLFAAGQERPAREFIVGHQMEVVQTGAMRTFIKEPDDDSVYRLRAAVGDLVRLPVLELRDRRIAAVGDGEIDAIRIEHADGHQVDLLYEDEQWKLADGPAAGRGLDDQRAVRLASNLAGMSAAGFPTEDAAELGLDEPMTVVTASVGDQRVALEVNRIDDDDGIRYVARRRGDDDIFEVEREFGELLTARLPEMQSRSLIPVSSFEITEIRLAGHPRVHLRREDADSDWEMTAPDGWTLDPVAVRRLAEFVAGLRVQRWVSDADDVVPNYEAMPRWTRGAMPAVVLAVEGEETVLYLGDEVEGRSGARYARYSESDDAFILSRSAVERLTGGPETVASAGEHP